jgi:hypothetical protein
VTDWADIRDFLNSEHFKDMDRRALHDEALRITYPLDKNRNQRVAIALNRSPGSRLQFVAVQSDFAYARPDTLHILTEAEKFLIGGVVQHGTTLAIRHALALPQTDLTTFEQALELVAKIADQLEEKLSENGAFDVH